MRYTLLRFLVLFWLGMGMPIGLQAQSFSLPDRLESSFRFMGGLMFVQVEINGLSGWLLMDTGTNSSILLNSYYFKGTDLGQQAQGMSGAQQLSMVAVDSLRWSTMLLKEISLPAMNLAALTADPGERVLGLLGSGFLKGYQFQMNFASRKIWLSKEKRAIPEVQGLTPSLELPFNLIAGFPVAEAAINGKTYRFVMDTGASDNILDESLSDTIAPIWKQKSQVTMQDAGGAGQQVRRGNLQSLNVGGLRMDGIDMSLSSLPKFDLANQIYGILGFQFFKYFFVDFNYLEGTIKCYDMQLVMPKMQAHK